MIDSHTGSDQAAGTSIPRRPAGLAELPASTLQRRWWTLLTSYPGGSAPIVSLVRRLRGPLDTGAWTRSVSSIVDRHESLRTLFALRPDGPVQLVLPPAGLEVERIDLTELVPEMREELARSLLNSRRELHADLEHGPLVTSTLVRLAEDDHVWTMTIHHILADGASLDIIERELGTLYRSFVEGTPADLPELPVQYGDYARWERTEPNPAVADDLRYWTRQLAGVPPLELPTDRLRPDRKGDPAAEVRRIIDAELIRRVEDLARSARSTRFMALLAALQTMLHRYSAQPDFCVGVPILGAARAWPELANLVGLFNNSLALRCDLAGAPTFRELLTATRDTVIDALDHQEVPFGRVVSELDIPPDPGRAQVFQVMFGMDESGETGGLRLPGVAVEEFPLAIPRILHDLMLYAWPVRDGLMTRFLYDTGLFDAGTVEGMARRYEEILRAAVDDPDTPVSRL